MTLFKYTKSQIGDVEIASFCQVFLKFLRQVYFQYLFLGELYIFIWHFFLY